MSDISNKKVTMFLVRIFSIFAVVASLAWLLSDPSYETAGVSFTAISVCMGMFIKSHYKEKQKTMHQSVEGNSIAIQAGGNVSMGEIQKNGNNKNV